MSVKNGKYPDEHAVDDEEGSVDKKLKDRIIKALNRVDETQQALFVKELLEPSVALSDKQKIYSWGVMVKQFLRIIEPLLQDGDVNKATEFYEEKKIGDVVMVPQPTDGYNFPMVAQLPQSATDEEIRRAVGLPRGAEIPQPRVRSFKGLKSIIEADEVLKEQWVVTIDDRGPRTEHKVVYPSDERPIPAGLYRDAVRLAQLFLQEAGIAIKIDADTGDAGFEYSDILEEGPPGVDTEGGDDA